MQKGLALFDFDGTITRKDSLLEFIKFTAGKIGYIFVMGIFSPIIFHYVYFRKEGDIAKRKVLSFLFKGKTKKELEQLGHTFAEEIIPKILLPGAIEEIKIHKKKGNRVIVISASLALWLKPWTDEMNVELICTEMEFRDGRYTGQFASPNCNGIEKVSRIKNYLDITDYHPIYAYGNSHGDEPMLALADHRFHKHFD